MFNDEVLFPGDMPDDPIALMRSLPPHRVPEHNLVIDGDPMAIARMEAVLGITNLLEDAHDLPVLTPVTSPEKSRVPQLKIGGAVVELTDNELATLMQPV